MKIDRIKPDRAYEVSTKGLFRDESGHILVIKEDGVWELPGGGLNHTEDPVTGLIRECKEELGVSCDVLDQYPYRVWTGLSPYEAPRLILLYRIKPLSLEFIPNVEAEEIKMVTIEEFKALNLISHLTKLKELL